MNPKKEKGNSGACFRCGKIMTCQEKEFNGTISLQWQNSDGQSHYDKEGKCKNPSIVKTISGEEVPYDTSSKVVWAKSDINQQTINNYDKIVSTAFLIAAMRHPDMDTNSNIFGTIVSAITGHLISMTS